MTNIVINKKKNAIHFIWKFIWVITGDLLKFTDWTASDN